MSRDDAVKAYQRSQGIQVDGDVGPETLGKLFPETGGRGGGRAGGAKAALDNDLATQAEAAIANQDALDAASASPRGVGDLHKEIAAKEAEGTALRGSSDPASVDLRRAKQRELLDRKRALEASPEYKAVQEVDSKKKELAKLEGSTPWFPTPYRRELHNASVAELRREVETKEAALPPTLRDQIEGASKSISDGLAMWSGYSERGRGLAKDAAANLDGDIARLKEEVGQRVVAAGRDFAP
jgi:hypothetical protein